MPITLGCPSCGKRFRARDESAGKKVKCPYCQTPVQVSTAEESAAAGAPTAPIPSTGGGPMPTPGPRPAPPLNPPPGPVVASPGDWGAVPTSGSTPGLPPPPPAKPAPEPEPLPTKRSTGRPAKERPKPARASDTGSTKTPEQVLGAGWARVRRGLFWVQFGLFWLALIGFVGLGKSVYERSVGPLPKGDGAEWVSIDGFINSAGQNAIPLRKEEMIDIAAYGVPVIFASILIVFGRLVASGGPRMSGSRGLFALSSLFGLLAFISLFATFLFSEAFPDYSRYGFMAFAFLAPLAEFWCLTAITACGVALRRPSVPRAVGAVAFVAALFAAGVTAGWEVYKYHWRPRVPDQDIVMYEQAILLLGWLLLVGVYWRAVRGVRVAAREYLDTVED